MWCGVVFRATIELSGENKKKELKMNSKAVVINPPATISAPPPPPPPRCRFSLPLKPSRLLRSVSCSSSSSVQLRESEDAPPPPPPPRSSSEYKPGLLDHVFLASFRSKMVKEVGWDSDKPGYDGLIEVANRLMLTGRTNAETKEAAVRILRSLFPPLLLDLYKMLISPLANGKVSAIMVARVTALTCQWLMGTCKVNSVDLPDGTSCETGVFVERCKYLEESKCVGICVNTCKLPTQSFFMDYMGVPLLMEPNFSDYSCQFKFGIHPPPPEDDGTLKEPCLETCPIASRRQQIQQHTNPIKCPKA